MQVTDMKEASRHRIESITSGKTTPPAESDILSREELEAFEKERERLQIRAPEASADSLSHQEEHAYDKEKKRIELDSLRQDIQERKKYANKIYKLIVCWLLAIFLLILVNGFFSALEWFSLSNTVMTTIVGGTTVNILGIFYIVANYLFHRPK